MLASSSEDRASCSLRDFAAANEVFTQDSRAVGRGREDHVAVEKEDLFGDVLAAHLEHARNTIAMDRGENLGQRRLFKIASINEFFARHQRLPLHQKQPSFRFRHFTMRWRKRKGIEPSDRPDKAGPTDLKSAEATRLHALPRNGHSNTIPRPPRFDRSRRCDRHRTPQLTHTRPFATTTRPSWGRSSVGRALEWHSRGRRFDPDRLHQAFVRSCASNYALASQAATQRSFERSLSRRSRTRSGRQYVNRSPERQGRCQPRTAARRWTATRP